MNKLIILFVSIAFCCKMTPTDKPNLAKADSTTRDSGSVASNDEDFNELFEKFKKDSLFQIERVKFPWKMMIATENSETIEETTRKEWTHSTFYYESSYATRQIDAYTQEIKNHGDTVKLELRGVDNGIYIDYEFCP